MYVIMIQRFEVVCKVSFCAVNPAYGGGGGGGGDTSGPETTFGSAKGVKKR